MDSVLEWLSEHPYALDTLLIIVATVTFSVTTMYLVAVLQGRGVKFWLPEIGQSPNNLIGTDARRTFISTTAGTLLGLLSGWTIGQARQQQPPPSSSSGSSIKKHEWVLATNYIEALWPDGNAARSPLHEAPYKLNEYLIDLTDGEFRLDITAIDLETAGLTDVFSEVTNGTYSCAYTGAYYFSEDKSRKFLAFSTSIPFGLTAEEQISWLLNQHELPSLGSSYNPNLTLMQNVYLKKSNERLIQLPLSSTGGQMGGWSRKKYENLKDLYLNQDRKPRMRIPGLGGEVFKRLSDELQWEIDVNPVLLSSQITDQVINGELDAAEWIGPYEDELIGLPTAFKSINGNEPVYYYYPGWWEPGPVFELLINYEKWNSLEAKYQSALRAACYRVYLESTARYTLDNRRALQRIANDPLIEMISFTPQIMSQSWALLTDEILENELQNDVLSQELFSYWKEFRREIRAWDRVSQVFYLHQRGDFNPISVNFSPKKTEG